MSNANHNGGPPITDDVPDMAYVKFFPGDFLNGTAHMSLEMCGAYIRTLCVMYDRMGGFPYNDERGAVLLRVDRRVYRRVRDHLLAEGKFYRDGDTIRNARVEREISDYITEYRRRSEAAKKRETERRLHRTSGELPAEVHDKSGGSSAEVHGKSAELETKNPIKTTNQTAQDDHIPESRSQNPEARSKKEDNEDRRTEPHTTQDYEVLTDRLVAACNGALDNPVNCLNIANLAVPLTWMREGCDLEMDILPTLRAYGKKKHGARIGSWNYFTRGVEQARDQRLHGIKPPVVRRQPASKKSDNSESYFERFARVGGFNGDEGVVTDIEILPPERAQ